MLADQVNGVVEFVIHARLDFPDHVHDLANFSHATSNTHKAVDGLVAKFGFEVDLGGYSQFDPCAPEEIMGCGDREAVELADKQSDRIGRSRRFGETNRDFGSLVTETLSARPSQLQRADIASKTYRTSLRSLPLIEVFERLVVGTKEHPMGQDVCAVRQPQSHVRVAFIVVPPVLASLVVFTVTCSGILAG